ncbi:MAG TPA: hypothetical protein VGD08_20535 [Stellaceae bacterium]|jgi:hypothetical protein
MTIRRSTAVAAAVLLALTAGACSSGYSDSSPYYSHPSAGGPNGTSLSPQVVPNSNEPANNQEVDPTKENYGSGGHR